MFILYVRTQLIVEASVEIIQNAELSEKPAKRWESLEAEGTSEHWQISKGFGWGGDGRRKVLRDWYNRHGRDWMANERGFLNELRLDGTRGSFNVVKTGRRKDAGELGRENEVQLQSCH